MLCHEDSHGCDGEHVGQDDQVEDVVVVVPEVAVPVVNGAGGAAGLQCVTPCGKLIVFYVSRRLILLI